MLLLLHAVSSYIERSLYISMLCKHTTLLNHYLLVRTNYCTYITSSLQCCLFATESTTFCNTKHYLVRVLLVEITMQICPLQHCLESFFHVSSSCSPMGVPFYSSNFVVTGRLLFSKPLSFIRLLIDSTRCIRAVA